MTYIIKLCLLNVTILSMLSDKQPISKYFMLQIFNKIYSTTKHLQQYRFGFELG